VPASVTAGALCVVPGGTPAYQAMGMPEPATRVKPAGKCSGVNLPRLITPMDWPGAAAGELAAPEDTATATALIHAPMSVPPDGLAQST
jgi:hypothetical protein